MVIELNQICHFPKKHLVQITEYFHYIYSYSSYWISLEVAAAEGCGWQLLWCFLRLKPHQSCSSQSEISNNQPQSHASQPSECIGTFKYVFQSASIPISEQPYINHKASNTPVILFKELLTLDCWWWWGAGHKPPPWQTCYLQCALSWLCLLLFWGGIIIRASIEPSGSSWEGTTTIYTRGDKRVIVNFT